MISKEVVALRLRRQHLINKSELKQYDKLYKDLQPGLNVYWKGFGDPPSLTFRANFNDIEYNRKRQRDRTLRKGRFNGGNLGWVLNEDFELFACLYQKPMKSYSGNVEVLLDLIRTEGPMNIHQMKEFTGMLTKEITPALHNLQKAFLIYEDQYDGEWDRAWYKIEEIFPELNLEKYTKEQALEVLINRFVYRNVSITKTDLKSYFKVPAKLYSNVLDKMVNNGVLVKLNDSYLLKEDVYNLENIDEDINRFVLALHRNDFLVRSKEDELKLKYKHEKHDILQYLLIDGIIKGAVYGKFRYGPNEIKDVRVDSDVDLQGRKEEILNAILNENKDSEILMFNGEKL